MAHRAGKSPLKQSANLQRYAPTPEKSRKQPKKLGKGGGAPDSPAIKPAVKDRYILKKGQFLAHHGITYTVLGHIRKGDNSDVYEVISSKTNEKLALKTEPKSEHNEPMLNRLKNEVDVLRTMETAPDFVDKSHFIKLIDKGSTMVFKYMVVDLVSKSLMDILKQQRKYFSASTVMQIAHQTLEAMEALHRVGYLHRDIKPHNFAVGFPPNDTKIYMIAFGIARRYIEARKLRYPRPVVRFIGTIRYASRSCHMEEEQCRRDDLESWIYFILELFDTRNLSWHSVHKKKEIVEMKEKLMSKPESCHLNMPERFVNIIYSVNDLTYSTPPVYADMHKIIDKICKDERIDSNDTLDWVSKPKEPKKKPLPIAMDALHEGEQKSSLTLRAALLKDPLKERMLLLEIELDEIYKQLARQKGHHELRTPEGRPPEDSLGHLMAVHELEKTRIKKEAELAEVIKKLAAAKLAGEKKVEAAKNANKMGEKKELPLLPPITTPYELYSILHVEDEQKKAPPINKNANKMEEKKEKPLPQPPPPRQEPYELHPIIQPQQNVEISKKAPKSNDSSRLVRELLEDAQKREEALSPHKPSPINNITPDQIPTPPPPPPRKGAELIEIPKDLPPPPVRY